MFKRRLAAAVVAAALPTLAVIAGPVSPASAAGSPGCITKAEYGQLRQGTPIKKARKIVGAKGKVTSSANLGDGLKIKSLSFRQCGSYGGAYVDFQSTERERYVPNTYCYDLDGDGYDETCDDYGYYETVYRNPLRLSSKYAFWG